MATEHILLAVDGTGSKKWRREDGLNSHVRRFYLNFHGPKEYMHGPNFVGDDVGSIIENGVRLVYKLVRESPYSVKDIRINLVGHSRGGFIVLKIANILSNPISLYLPSQHSTFTMGKGQTLASNINFIGLYDAVKRCGTETDVNFWGLRHVGIAHAYRKNMLLSRPSFQGINVPLGVSNFYDTSHGGVGGDPGFFDSLVISKDLYCNALDLFQRKDQSKWEYLGLNRDYSTLWRLHQKSNPNDRKTQLRTYLVNSTKADDFIRLQAFCYDVPLNSLVPDHIPWEAEYENLGQQLKSKLYTP